MIVLAVLGTIAALCWNVFVVFANGMSSSPQPFQGVGSVALAWLGAAVLWLAWGMG